MHQRPPTLRKKMTLREYPRSRFANYQLNESKICQTVAPKVQRG
jgi:hypothetical protein